MKYINVDLSSSVPIYEQIILQVKAKILSGIFLEGESLPTIRQLANDLELNHNTVAKSYRILEKEGLIITAGRKGTFISEDAILNLKRNEMVHINSEIFSLMKKLKQKGLNRKEILEIINKCIEEV